jgi:hypothetical protein
MSVIHDPRHLIRRRDAVPACPACGGLECLCRPRFFAGQLLTDEDLNRLDAYIRGKNRLHNRMLHGWGTVNGLEVTCTPCRDTVTVSAGYAVSPCGEDIVVCHDAEVPVCDLIQACRRQAEDDCRPGGRQDDGCRDTEQEWVLAVCYEETPTRGVAALRGASAAPACAGCRCNGTTDHSCGCDCHIRADPRARSGHGRPQPAPLAQCEPTAVCEGHRFRVYRASRRARFEPRDNPALEAKFGPLATRYRACLTAIGELTLDPLPGDASAADRTAAWRRLCTVKADLGDFLATHGGYSCELARQLAAIPIPDPNDQTFPAVYDEARAALDAIRSELQRYCRCHVVLPPAPDPVDDDCVPLATITVRGDDCTIIDICNFGVRKLVLSAPALEYWLSLTPFGSCLNAYLAAGCCGDRSDMRACYRFLAAGMTGLGRRLAGAKAGAAPVEFLASALAGQPEPRLDFSRLLHAEVERDELWRERAFDDLIGPLVEAFVQAPSAADEAEGEDAEAAGPAELREELVLLRRIVRRQQERIDDLIDRLDTR